MMGGRQPIKGGAHVVPPPGAQAVDWAMSAARVLAVGAGWLSQKHRGAWLEWLEDGNLYIGTGELNGLVGLLFRVDEDGNLDALGSEKETVPVIALTNGMVYKLIVGRNDRTMKIAPGDEHYPLCSMPDPCAKDWILSGILSAMKSTFHPVNGFSRT